jgi:hypothetical protein
MGKTTPKGALGSEERTKLLALINQGFGIQLALTELKTNWRRYDRTIRKVRGFRGSVKRALEYQVENLVSLRYSAAIEGSERAQEFLINRADRARYFSAEMRRRRAEQKAREPERDRDESLDPEIARRIYDATNDGSDPTFDEPGPPAPQPPADGSS